MKSGTDSHVLAAYLRLSCEDGDMSGKSESNSISNQRKLIEHYVISHSDLAELQYTEYIDDGYSGTNTARPSFRKMISRSREGKINCIIVKDMSRFARNYLTLGDYMEQIFPALGIRFISINDHYDSKEQTSYLQSMSAALHGLVYSYYSHDLSKKNEINIKARIKNGTYTVHSPYGYKTDWKNYRFEIDPEAAVVVRLIFDLTLSGHTPANTAKLLNDCQIPSPSGYARLHPELGKPWHQSPDRTPLWTVRQIKRILRNETYTGKQTLNKTYVNAPNHIKLATPISNGGLTLTPPGYSTGIR